MPENRPRRSDDGIRIVDADWPAHEAAIRAIRQAVFITEQGIPGELEWDGCDAHCHHVLALLPDGRPVGTGRLQPDGRLGRMAVLRAWRGRGVGRAILHRLEQQARDRRLETVYLHAQTDAAGFYEKAGFRVAGPVFMEAGIPHLEMTRRLG